MKTITIRIPRDGVSTGQRLVQVEADGFTGTACQDATKALIDALGSRVDEQAKSERAQPVFRGLSASNAST